MDIALTPEQWLISILQLCYYYGLLLCKRKFLVIGYYNTLKNEFVSEF